mmetsp:Transcript_27892/g.89969  ORF Transcript_27892/g.89969 Transcript_27892/m.89969 type:complete len:243 (-) Transcript_27892:763-1491(-)
MSAPADSAQQAPASISAVAYGKIMMHSAKYPHCDVIGVLTGVRKADNGRPAVHDAFPLCHNPVTASIFELAMLVLDKLVERGTAGEICGIYFATGIAQERGLSPVAERIASKIADRCHGSVALLVDHEALGTPGVNPLRTLRRSGSAGSWSSAPADSPDALRLGPASAPRAIEQVDAAIAAGGSARVVDFEDYLAATELDWTNAWVAEETLKGVAAIGGAAAVARDRDVAGAEAAEERKDSD